MTRNTFSAVMQQRAEPHDSLDDFPMPDWAALDAHHGGILFHPAAGLADVRRGARGRVVCLVAAHGAETDMILDVVTRLARIGVTAVSPDLIRALAVERLGSTAMPEVNWPHWRWMQRDAADGLVILPRPDPFESAAVWADVCAALALNRPVWILTPDAMADSVDDGQAADEVDF